jgi:hypothetical protein
MIPLCGAETRSKRGLGASQLRPPDDPGMAKLRRIKSGQLEFPNFVAEGCDQDADEYREGKAEENFPADP